MIILHLSKQFHRQHLKDNLFKDNLSAPSQGGNIYVKRKKINKA